MVAKPKKPKRSTAWKSAEKLAARAIAGSRISRGSNYGKQLADGESDTFVVESKYGKQTHTLGWLIRILQKMDEGLKGKLLEHAVAERFSGRGASFLHAAYVQACSYGNPPGWTTDRWNTNDAPRVVFIKPPRMVGGMVVMEAGDFKHLCMMAEERSSGEGAHVGFAVHAAVTMSSRIKPNTAQECDEWYRIWSSGYRHLVWLQGFNFFVPQGSKFFKRPRVPVVWLYLGEGDQFVCWLWKDHMEMMRLAGYDVDAPHVGKVKDR